MKNFTDEKTLLREIKNGNGEAFEFLFNSYYPRLRGYAARFVTDEEAVRDIIQESFLRFWEKRDLIEAVSISSLLFAMVRNACLNYLKHLQLVEQHNLEHLDRVAGQEELYYWDFNLSPEYTLLYKELQQQISLVMSDLPSRCREVFEMSRFKKMKNREIADALQISTSFIRKAAKLISTTAVEKHIAKALARFSAHFKDKYPLDVYIAILAWLLSE